MYAMYCTQVYFKDKAGPYKFRLSVKDLEIASHACTAPAEGITTTIGASQVATTAPATSAAATAAVESKTSEIDTPKSYLHDSDAVVKEDDYYP